MSHSAPSGVNPNTTNTQANPSVGDELPAFADGGGSVADVTPIWGESLPAWADDLIALLTAGQTWPEASESRLWELARAHRAATVSLLQSIDPMGTAAVAVLNGMQGPSMTAFLDRLGEHYSERSGLLGVADNHFAYAVQADNFARGTQHSKLSINVVFLIALTSMFIALVAAFYSAGASTRFIGPIAARARAETMRILERLAVLAGRSASTRGLARGTALASAKAGLLSRVLANPLGRELVEEIGEEVAGDGIAQRQQRNMGTRDGWDWRQTGAVAVGAAGGAAVGLRAARPVSNLVNRTPLLRRLNTDAPGVGNAFKRFPGRALTTGLTNVIASPAGSVLGNGLVYGQWEMPGADSLLGAALGGAGRTNTISPFNPDVLQAVASPRTALAEAYDTSVRTDLIRAFSDPTAGQPAGGGPAAGNGGPTVSGGTGNGGPTVSGGTSTASVVAPPSTGPLSTGPAAASSGSAPASAATTSSPAQSGGSTANPGASGTSGVANTSNAAGAAGAATATGTSGAANASGASGTSGTSTAGPGTSSAASAGNATSAAGSANTGNVAGAASAGNASGGGNAGGVANGGTGAAPVSGTANAAAPGPAAAAPAPVTAPGAQAASSAQGASSAAGSANASSASAATPSAAGPAPAASSAISSAASPQASARTAVSGALGAIAPDAVVLPDGRGARLTGPDGRPVELSGDDMAEIADRLAARAAEGVDAHRLHAEAAALLGARIAEESLGLPAEGAFDALARLADTTPDARAAAMEVAGEVLEDNPRGWRPDRLSAAGTGLVEEVAVRPHGPDHALRVGRSTETAAEIVRRAESLAAGTVAPTSGAANPAAGGPPTSTTPSAPGSTPRPATRPGPRTTRGHGTVTAQRIDRSLFVADGRPPHLADLSPEEAVRGFLSLHASVLGPDVTELSLAGERMVVADTGQFGSQHFRFEIGRVRGGRPARTRVREGTARRPHVVRLAPRLANDVLRRVWLHEISDVFQRLSGPRQGSIRSFLRRTAKPDPAACLTARYREHALLDRDWQAAPEAERPAIRHEIEQLGREIERLGHVAPTPPWTAVLPRTAVSAVAPGPATPNTTTTNTTTQSTTAQSAPDPVADLLVPVRTQRETLANAAGELRTAASEKDKSLRQALTDAHKAKSAAAKTAREKDLAAAERRRKILADADVHRSTAERAGLSKEAYERAATRAAEASEAYEKLENALNALPPGRPGPLPAQVAQLARDAEAAHTAYTKAVADAVPSSEVLPEATPAGRLPHLERLTRVVNDMLERAGVDQRYAPDELSHVLRSNFRWLVSPDGMLLRVGRGTRGELRLRLKVTDLVEVFGEPVRHSQSMLGQLPQGGRSASATANRSLRLAPRLDLNALTAPWQNRHWLAALMRFGVFNGGFTVGRSESINGGAAEFALAGAVQDNAGEALVFDGLASAEVELRTATGTDRARVDGGTSGDARSLRLYLPHTHAQREPAEVTRLPKSQWQRTPFPEHSVTGLTGLQDLAERTARRAGRAAIGGMTRDQIFTILTKELPARLGEAINDPGGLHRPITANGRVIGYVRIETTVVPETARPVGAPSVKHRLERLRVGFSGASGSRSAGRSRGVAGTAGGKLPIGDQGLLGDFGLDGYSAATPRLTLGIGRSWSRSRSMSAGGTAIRPSVQRWAGHTQAYALELEHMVTVHLNSEDAPLAPVLGTGAGLFRMPESQAYRYGLPVDRSALRKDGRLRDDPKPGAPKGRLPELPGWARESGAGPGLVQASDRQDSVRTLDEVRAKVVAALREQGLLPDENGGLSRDPLARASQIANMIEVAAQFSPARLQTGYDQARQDGIVIDLVSQGIGRPSRHHTLRIRLRQSGGEEFLGTSAADVVADLDISSETSGRSVSRSAGRSRDLGVGLGLEAKPGENGLTGGGSGLHANRGRTAGTTLNDTVNHVTLIEGTSPAAVFEVPHTLTVELVEGGGKPRTLAESDGMWMRVLLPADLLPERRAEPSPAHPTSREALSLATLLHVDGSGVLDALGSVLPKAMRPGTMSYHHLAEAFNMRALISHPEWLVADTATRGTAYGTAAAVRQRGLRTHRASAWITAQPGESTFLTAADLVIGDINFTMGAHSTRMETRRGRSVDASTGVAEDLPGPFGGTQGGSLSGAGSRASAITDTAIWGRERLAIDTGKHYVFAMEADITVSGDEQGSRQARADVPGRTVVYSLPERDALTLYGSGEIKLPLGQVADAVTRLLDGNLELDPRTAVPMVRRYLADRALARRAGHPRPDLEKQHPRAVLAERLAADFPMGRAAGLRQLQDRLPDLAVRVDVPDLYVDSLGESTLKSAVLTTQDGTRTRLIDEVLGQIGRVAPGALKRDPVLLRSLFGDLAGKRWWGKIDDMTGPAGFVKTYSLRIGPQLTEDVTLRITAELHGDQATYGGGVHDFGQILQDYTYLQQEAAESSGKTFGGGANAGAGLPDGSGGFAVATDRSHTGTATVGTQRTRIQRHAAFRGGQLIEHPVTIRIEVERSSGRLRGAVARTTGVPRTSQVTLGGAMVRVLPDGMVAKAGTVPAPPPARPDIRRVTPPDVFTTVGLRADGLLQAVFGRLSRPDLLGGAAAMEHYAELAKTLTGNGAATRLEWMTGPAGHRLVRLPMPGSPGQVVDVRVRAVLSEPDPVAVNLNDTELGQVDREQNMASASTDRGHMLPLGRSYSGGAAAGAGGDIGVGDQTTQSSSGGGGNRDETSVFQKGTAALVRLRVDFDLRFEVREVAPNGAETLLRTAEIARGATGTAHLVMFQHALEEMLARRDAAPARPTWDFGRPRHAAPGMFFSHDAVLGMASQRPSYDPAAPTRAMAEALRERTGSQPVGIVADLGAAHPMTLVNEARLLARDLGADVHLHLRRPDGEVERYHATPRGELTGDPFAEALGRAPADLVDLAVRHGFDLRGLYAERPDGFADLIAERLGALGVSRPAPADPGWPVPETAADGTWGGNPLITGPPGGSVTAKAIDRSAFVADGRAPHLPDLANDEIPAAVASLRPAVFGRGVHSLSVTPDGRVVFVETARFGTQRFAVLPEDPGGGRPGRTDVHTGTDPHVSRLAPRLAPDLVARVLLHEISDTLQKRAEMERGRMRAFLNALNPGYDACADARRNEHAHLSQLWLEASSDEERARLRHEIEAVAWELGARGQAAPPPPWMTAPPPAPVVGVWERMRRLSNPSGGEPPEDEDEDDEVLAPEETGR
ncbi:hypothetical protein [Microbispora sp. H11081]|uniref:WXG100-like domain-containing protein n=1 Tax=Microbispora sp. H11081 TaxID=2729107 RepID=UPI0014731DDB|nr:hypothetical protein [Microbispora sp. H11081]